MLVLGRNVRARTQCNTSIEKLPGRDNNHRTMPTKDTKSKQTEGQYIQETT